LHLWFRLRVHTLLRESRIFPSVELYDESPDYVHAGFANTWKGDYDEGPMRAETHWTKELRYLSNAIKVCGSFGHQRHTKYAPYETFHRVIKGIKYNPHPKDSPFPRVSVRRGARNLEECQRNE